MANTLRMTPDQAAAHNARVRKGTQKAEAVIENSAAGILSRDEARQMLGIPSDKLPDSYSEFLARQLEAQGVKGLEREYFWCRGKRYRSDLALPSLKLLIECIGGVHRINDKARRDIERQQFAVLQGWVMFPVSNKQVRSGEAVRLVQQAILTLKAGCLPF